ncbi:TonB-dependent siderophore receptor [Scytonema sp. PCC 10023]|uniref:TonB-dependent siderophore receptor n=1 Tax=Scytonema sp. PCC 10023 TaxID=1680591 RepID=UPI0039C75FAA
MKLDKMFQSLLLTSAAIVFIITPAQGEEVPEDVQGKSSVTPGKPTSRDTGKVTNKGLAITQSSRFAPKSKKTQLSSSLTSVNSLQPTKKILQLSEIEHFSKSAELLVQSPTPTPTNPPNPEQRSGEQVVPITGVKANATNKGVEVILQTTVGQQLQVSNRSAGNNFIADISGAQLRLPSGEAFTFRSEKPLTGITEITVTNVNANTVRVTVVGEKALPTVELFDDNAGLVFGITSAATAMQPPQQPETPQKPEPEKPASETPQDKPLNSQQDEPIELVVTGEQDGYRVTDSSTATKTDTPLRDIPQSIQVVPQEVIKDRQPRNLVDALRSVPGISQANQSSTSIYEDPRIRGFDATTDVLRDGTRSPYSTFNSFDSATTERIEVLRGPASVLYGQGSLGGVINIISKQPLSEPYYFVEASAGSFNFYRGAIDLSGPLNSDKTLLYRLNFAAKTTESFVDNFDRQQYLVAPVISWQIGDRTNLRLSAEYTNISGSYGQMGLPAAGTILPNPNGEIPLSRNLSEPSLDRDDVELFRIGYNLEHRFSDNWQLRSIFEAAWIDQDRAVVFPVGQLQANRTLQRRLAITPINGKVFNLDNYVVGQFATGSIQHQLLAGFNYTREEQESFTRPRSRLNLAPIDIFNPVYNPTLGTQYENPFEGESTANTYGFYIQDQISLIDNLKLLLGGRFDIANQRIVNTFGANGSAEQEVFSPRVGLVYQPIPAISLYANYGRSFRPTYNVFESGTIPLPERGTLYEVGVKADLSDRITATLAFYDQTRTNISTQDPNNPLRRLQIGEQNSQGVEFNISGEILPGWNIVAGYAYTDARISEGNSNFPVGNRINGVPEHSFNLWTSYKVQEGSLQGLGFGLGLFYQGERQGDLANTFELPSYLRTDAAIFYERDQFRAAVNFRNLFDIDYFESAFNINRVFPGDPLEVQGSISWRF